MANSEAEERNRQGWQSKDNWEKSGERQEQENKAKRMLGARHGVRVSVRYTEVRKQKISQKQKIGGIILVKEIWLSRNKPSYGRAFGSKIKPLCE